MNMLNQREAAVICVRYGFDEDACHNGSGPRTLEETGKMLKINREDVRAIEVAALRKLRHAASARMGEYR